MKKILLYIFLMLLVTACQAEKNLVSTGAPPTQPINPTVAATAYPTQTPRPSATASPVPTVSLTPAAQVTAAPTATDITATQKPVSPKDSECLAPLVTFSYQLGDGAPGADWHDTLPSEDWIAVSMAPGFPTPLPPAWLAEYGENPASLETIQTVNGKDKIWVYFETADDYHFTYYQIGTGRWGSAKYATKDNENLFFFPQLFLDSHNTLWASGNPTNAKGLDADTTLLSVYDETSQQFKSVLALKDLPIFDVSKLIDTVNIANLQMDSQGNLWFFLHVLEDAKGWASQLFKFAPSSHTLERYLTDIKLDSFRRGMSFVIFPGDVLYLLGVHNVDLLRYDPAKEETEEIEIPSGLESNGGGDLSSRTSLFLDSHQRLLINDKGWLDLSQREWNIIIQSPIFVVLQAGSGLWGRDQPTYSLETKDGRLWYSAYSGTGWVDPSTGKWCLFTTHPSKIAKDSKGHLWLVASGKLYRSLFKP